MINQKIYFVGALISLIAILPFPTGFYFFTRIALCLILLLITYELYQSNIKFWIFTAPLALLYNPIIPIYLYSKSLWIFINIGTAIIIMISLFLKKDDIKRLKALDEYNKNKNEQKEIVEEVEEVEEIIEQNPIAAKSNHYSKEIHNDKQSKVSSKLITKINQSLNQQFKKGGFSSKQLKPETDYVIGYIVGFCDGFLIHHSIDSYTAKGFSFPSLSLIEIFGPKRGPKLLNKFLNTQLNMTVEMEDGRKAGYDDALETLEIGLKPNKLARHLNQNKTSPSNTGVSLSESDIKQINALSMLIQSFIMEGSGTLLGQFMKGGGLKTEDIPKDNWIIGYIAGFVGAQLSDWGRTKDIDYTTVFTNNILINIYEDRVNFKDFIYLFDNEDKETIDGFNDGFLDYDAKKNEGKERIRTKLTHYVFSKNYLSK